METVIFTKVVDYEKSQSPQTFWVIGVSDLDLYKSKYSYFAVVYKIYTKVVNKLRSAKLSDKRFLKCKTAEH